MQPVRKINDELAIAGQITPDQLAQLAQEGYSSVLNLRLPNESGLLQEESQKVQYLSLNYVNLPLQADNLNPEMTTPILQALDALPKPILIHCDNALRAAAIALLYIAVRQGIEWDRAIAQAQRFIQVVGT
jgi:uncharacterized protein (TIGR01244 family)